MSSRQLRKLQRQQEEEEEARKAQSSQNDEVDEDSDEDADAPTTARNVFDTLNDQEESAESEDDSTTARHAGQNTTQASEHESTSKGAKASKRKKKKKAKRSTASAVVSKTDKAVDNSKDMDEIDQALQSLDHGSSAPLTQATSKPAPQLSEGDVQLHRLLAVESKYLNYVNEMKKLFGRAINEEDEVEAAEAARRRGRGPVNVDLGTALSAKYSPVSRGQGLKGLLLKRNPLILGKEEWPMTTSGGLGMELVEKMDDGTTEYRFVHSTAYQDTQMQFEVCVESMDPQRMIALLQFNPYHISTLLQVSEIAKQQGDRSVSGDLLERALFNFGRSAHSSFATAMASGRARLDFRRPENREFWLAAWRYLNNLGRKGTWRTAYEWAKLILSLDPEGDPYCISKCLDQFALRGGQAQHYLDICTLPTLFRDDLWSTLPNVAISPGLALQRLKKPQESRAALAKAVGRFPWVFVRLFQELGISSPIPPSIWGQTPRTEWEKYTTELYVLNTKDLWSTPEAISLLVEVAETSPKAAPLAPDANSSTATATKSTQDQQPGAPTITIDDARVTILAGVNALINLIPRNFTSQSTSASDPLPPEDNLLSYDDLDTRVRRNNRYLQRHSHHPGELFDDEGGEGEGEVDEALERAYADFDAEQAEREVEGQNAGADGQARAGVAARLAQMFMRTGRLFGMDQQPPLQQDADAEEGEDEAEEESRHARVEEASDDDE